MKYSVYYTMTAQGIHSKIQWEHPTLLVDFECNNQNVFRKKQRKELNEYTEFIAYNIYTKLKGKSNALNINNVVQTLVFSPVQT